MLDELITGRGMIESVMVWAKPKHTAGLAPIFAESAEPAQEWTKEPPNAPGHYWVWQPAEDWPCHGEPIPVVVEVGVRGGEKLLLAWGPKMDYGWPVVPILSRDSYWGLPLWLGPIDPPKAPAGGSAET